MKIFKTPDELQAFINNCPDPELRELLSQRLSELSQWHDTPIAHFYILESAQDLSQLPPTPELREDFQSWTELVYVLSDDGFGLEVFVPKGLI